MENFDPQSLLDYFLGSVKGTVRSLWLFQKQDFFFKLDFKKSMVDFT